MKALKYFLIIAIALGMQSCVLDDVFDCEHGRGGVIEETFSIDDIQAPWSTIEFDSCFMSHLESTYENTSN